MTIRIVLVISMLAAVAPAAVKRDDYSSNGASAASQPVYSPSAPANSYSAPAGSFGSAGYGQAQAQGFSGDHSAAASNTNFQSQPASQGNLYYYYYPVQEKPKEGQAYQAAASNTYASAVTPNFGSQASASSEVASTSHTDNSASVVGTGTGTDLNYSAQDLSYSAQTLNQGLSDYQQNGQNNNYDQTLSNLANQLQQYGYSSSGSNSFAQNTNGQQAQAQQQPQQTYGQGYTYEAAHGSQASGSEPASAYQATGSQIPNFQATANAFGPQTGNTPITGFHPGAAAAFANFPNQHFGNFGAASGQHAAFEPAASGYRRYGIGSFLMPMLALAGLSLLIPTVTSLTASGRKKRSVDSNQSAKESAFGKYFDRLERYYSMYKTAVEREECMNRIICELGDVMTGARGKSAIFTSALSVIEKVVPTWMGNSVGVLKTSAMSSEYGKCKKYTCQK